MDSYKSTSLWKRSLGIDSNAEREEALAVLKGAYKTFRDNAGDLTSKIAISLPNLTIHDLTHLDALWETADLIAGECYPINPAEGFVLGGAILLHDAALCFEAYRDGKAGLRATVEWRDALVAIESRGNVASNQENEDEADFFAMRSLHASQAAKLALRSWLTPEGDTIYLIDKIELRTHYGKLIGDIAASHHWPIEDVATRLQTQVNAPAGFPREWRVDPIKIACLLRCADAAHIDSRRAPDFLRALARLHGISAHHWTAQNWLQRADYDTADVERNAIIFTSGKPFDEQNSEAWWVAYDAIQLVDRELKSVASLLADRPQAEISPPFKVQRVTGATSPEETSRTIETVGWSPQAVQIHVSNLERLISRLGGEKLYGEDQSLIVSLRELIQNARDAIVARSVVDDSFEGRVRIIHKSDGMEHTLIVEDDGIGMSERVITGPLLDFGESFWASNLVRNEFPGLLAGGYRPVGKYGIGFYSIFMVASDVSVASRRFDAGRDSVVQVKFPNGLSLRPIVVKEAPDDLPYRVSTRVSIKLRPELGDPSNIIVQKERPGYEEAATLQLDQCLAILCAGLDVHVDLVDITGNPKNVHKPISMLNTFEERKDWLARIVLSKNGRGSSLNLESTADRLRPITLNGKTFGLAALAITGMSDRASFGSVTTVGGLAASIAGTEIYRFVGAIDFEPNTARRDATSEFAAGNLAMDMWAQEQKQLLPDRSENPMAWCIATISLADMQIDPIDIVTSLVRIGDKMFVCDIDELLEIVCSSGLAFYQSPNMRLVEKHHDLGSFEDLPTFWPIMNSSFNSLARDDRGDAPVSSILSCIERHARINNVSIIAKYLPDTVKGHFGDLPVLVLRGTRL